LPRSPVSQCFAPAKLSLQKWLHLSCSNTNISPSKIEGTTPSKFRADCPTRAAAYKLVDGQQYVRAKLIRRSPRPLAATHCGDKLPDGRQTRSDRGLGCSSNSRPILARSIQDDNSGETKCCIILPP